jgi:hypothetical protein
MNRNMVRSAQKGENSQPSFKVRGKLRLAIRITDRPLIQPVITVNFDGDRDIVSPKYVRIRIYR